MEDPTRKIDSVPFQECIYSYYASLESNLPNKELQELFFNFCENSSNFPEMTDKRTLTTFVKALELTSANDPNEKNTFRALMYLFKFLKNDSQVFQVFTPTKFLLRKLKIEKFLMTMTAPEIYNDVCDFVCFLLRYYPQIEYEDFTDLNPVINRIRRAEMHRSWVDLEDTIIRNEKIDQVFKVFQATTSAAIGEIFGYFEKMKKDVENVNETYKNSSKTINETMDKYDQKILKIEKLYAHQDNVYDLQKEDAKIRNELKEVESKLSLQLTENFSQFDTAMKARLKILEEQQNTHSKKVGAIETKFEVEIKKNADLEMGFQTTKKELETYINKMKVLSETMDDNKKNFLARVARLESEVVQAKANNARPYVPPADVFRDKIQQSSETNKNELELLNKKYENLSARSDKLETNLGQIESLLGDVSTSVINTKMTAFQKQFKDIRDDINALFTKVDGHTLVLQEATKGGSFGVTKEMISNSEKVVETQRQQMQMPIDKLREDFLKASEGAFESRFTVIAQEIKSLKIQQEAEVVYSKNIANQLESVKQKVDSSSFNNKKAVDDIVNESITAKLAHLSKATTEELNRLGNFFQEFINEQAFSKVRLLRNYEASINAKMDGMEWIARNAEFISAKIMDEAMRTYQEIATSKPVTALRTALVTGKHTSDVMNTMAILLQESSHSSLKEQHSLMLVYLKLLSTLLYSDSNVEKALLVNMIDVLIEIVKDPSFDTSHKVQSLMNLVALFRNESAPPFIMNNKASIQTLVETISSSAFDEDIILNAMSVIKSCLRHVGTLEQFCRQHKNLPTILLTNLERYEKINDNIVIETLGAIRWYTTKLENLDSFKNMTSLNKIIDIARDEASSKEKKHWAIAVLKNCGKNPTLANHLKMMGVWDFVHDPVHSSMVTTFLSNS